MKPDKRKIEKVFITTFYDSVIVNSAFCNENDTIYNLKLHNYRITAWKLLRYKDIVSYNINLDFNNKNRDFYLTLSSEIEISPVLKITYKIPDYLIENITLNLSKTSEVYDTINYRQNKGYYFRTSKFGIGDSKKRSNIIFDFGKEKRDVILIFLNNEKQNYMMVLYPYNDKKINSNDFLKMLN